MSSEEEDSDCGIFGKKRLNYRRKIKIATDAKIINSQLNANDSKEFSTFAELDNENKPSTESEEVIEISCLEEDTIKSATTNDKDIFNDWKSPAKDEASDSHVDITFESTPSSIRGRRPNSRDQFSNRGSEADILDPELILQKLDEQANEICNDLNECFDTCDDCIIEERGDPKTSHSLLSEIKFNFHGKIRKVQISSNEKIYNKLDMIAEQFKIDDPLSLAICFNNKLVSMDATPKSLNLTVADILDCIIKQASFTSADNSHSSQYEKVSQIKDPNIVSIKFRNNKSSKNSKPITLNALKAKELQNVMLEYAEIVEIEVKKLNFYFDGEKLNGNETPEDLEMEDGNLIDVVIKE
ncbi:NFATC2-interacting protein-like protein [Dinothrombium tinctorium]|uniref:NFATC2-interacting protein-like protein n=1 Tax=Dinothrombium tinctorium TaxID=1965070 RepID=A0A443REP4_9ACAR|nr:NFATC2-interacting protein-like protein [Dinothrombium tinctorium]